MLLCRETALASKDKELEELINRKECLVPHFNKALKQVLNATADTVRLEDGGGCSCTFPFLCSHAMHTLLSLFSWMEGRFCFICIAFAKGLPLESPGGLKPPAEDRTRPSVDLKDVTRSDVRICMWKPPSNAAEAAQGTAQMLLKLFERRKNWTRPPLPPNYMHAFERTTYSLDCVYVSTMCLRRHC